MPDLWGMQGGSQMAETDLRSQAVQQATIAHTLSDIGMMPGRNRLVNAQADEAEMKVGNERKMQAALATMGAGTDPNAAPVSLTKQFADLAQTMIKAGLPEQAAKFGQVAGTMAYRDSQAIAQRATQAKTLLETEHKEASILEGVTRNVNSQESLDKANGFYEALYRRPSPLAGMTYSPEAMEDFRNSTISRKDAVNQQLREVDQQDRRDWHGVTADYRQSRKAIFEAEQRVRERREDRLSKAGGKPLTAPTKSEFTPAYDLVMSEVFGGATPEGDTLAQAKIAASDLASEAKVKTRANPALDYSTALHKAYEESKARGDWETLKADTMLGIQMGKDKKKYSRKGALGGDSPDAAAPMPTTAAGAQVGKYYRSPNGQIGKWNGKTFDLVSGAKPAARAPVATLPPDDEEEDDE